MRIIKLANKDDIPSILEILQQRCKWLEENKIEQWENESYTELYNADYFIEVMNIYKLYVVKELNEVIGVFLLKDKDKEYWKDEEKAYYIHHFATKLGYPRNRRKNIKIYRRFGKTKWNKVYKIILYKNK